MSENPERLHHCHEKLKIYIDRSVEKDAEIPPREKEKSKIFTCF